MDFDDFTDKSTHELGLLYHLKWMNGDNFKVTLFTIPRQSTVGFLEEVNKIPWIELGIHGWDHSPRECENWTYKEAKEKIKISLSSKLFAPIFKAPYWLFSNGTYKACKDLGVKVCDHFKNDHPKDAYVWGKPNGIIQAHGHLTSIDGNYIGRNMNKYIFKNKKYKFISEL